MKNIVQFVKINLMWYHFFVPILWLNLVLPEPLFALHEKVKVTESDHIQQPADEKAQKITVDAVGNSYVTGYKISAGNTSQVQTIKYSPTGEQLWVTLKNLNISGEVLTDIAFSEGSVFVLASVGGKSFLMRYAAATGSEVWTKQHHNAEGKNVALQALSVDDTDGLYVTGFIYTGVSGGADYVSARYNAATGDMMWERFYDNDHNNDQAYAIAVDKRGGVYVTGLSWGPGTTIQYATIRYSADSGDQVWVTRYNGSSIGYSRASAIAVDNEGGVYVTGTVELFEGFPSDWDYGTVRYDAMTGVQTWASHYHVDGKINKATDIAVDNSGGVYVTGYSNTLSFDHSNANYTTVRFSASTGAQSWVAHYEGPAGQDDQANAIAVDNNGGIYVTGFSWGIETSSDFATVRYDAATGAQVWLSRYNGAANGSDRANDIAVSSTGSVLVTGWSQQVQNSQNTVYTTISYNSATGEQEWSTVEDENCGTLTDVKLYLPPTPLRVGQQVRTTADFGSRTFDENTGIQWTWGDGSTPSVSYTAFGTARITGEHRYTSAGIYQVGLDFSQSCFTTTVDNFEQWMVIYDPNAGFITGAGTTKFSKMKYSLMTADGTLGFNFNVKYNDKSSRRPNGQTTLRIDKRNRFKSNSIDWLVVSGNKAVWKGEGTINNKGRYSFIASASDAGGKGAHDSADRFRVLILDMNRGGTVVFDNFDKGDIYDMNLSSPLIERGQIIIHGLKGKSNTSGIASGNEEVLMEPVAEHLYVYPNTFTDRATLSFVLSEEQQYAVEVYDTKGVLVTRLATGKAEAGKTYKHEFSGDKLSEGIYIFRLLTETGSKSVKVLLSR